MNGLWLFALAVFVIAPILVAAIVADHEETTDE